MSLDMFSFKMMQSGCPIRDAVRLSHTRCSQVVPYAMQSDCLIRDAVRLSHTRCSQIVPYAMQSGCPIHDDEIIVSIKY